MVATETLQLTAAAAPAQLWRAAAAAIRGWLAQQCIPPADAVVLLPFAELIAPARRALAETGDWLPRLHTTRTLASALGPEPPQGAGEVSGDAAVDRAAGRELLRDHDWAAAWLQRDPRAFDAALDRLVHTAHALRAKASALPPHERAAWWQQARQQLPSGSGVGATHRLLLRAALEWCALSDGAASDRLFAHRPAAWVVVTLGGEDELALGVARAGTAHGVPALHLCADPVAADPLAGWPEQCEVVLQEAADAGFAYCGQSIFSSTFVIILERNRDAAVVKYEYLLLATRKTGTMQKELAEAGERGFRYVGVTVAQTGFGGNEVVTILRRPL